MLKYKVVNIAFVILLILLIIYDWQIGISWLAYVVLIIGLITLQTYGSVRVSSQFFVPVKCKGISANGVALTFDDGPVPLHTRRVLSILKQYNTTATFFCIGNRVERHPELLQEIYSDGHVIGNHTYSHGKFFDLLSSKKMTEELNYTDNVIHQSVGVQPNFFRPPYGVTNPNLAKAIKKGGYTTMGWSIRSFDTVTKDAEKLFARVTKKIEAGDVILFHDFCESTIQILPRVIEHINKSGLKIVRLDELMNEKAYV